MTSAPKPPMPPPAEIGFADCLHGAMWVMAIELRLDVHEHVRAARVGEHRGRVESGLAGQGAGECGTDAIGGLAEESHLAASQFAESLRELLK